MPLPDAAGETWLHYYTAAGGSQRAVRVAYHAIRLSMDNRKQKWQCISGLDVTAGQFLVYL